MAHSVRIMQLPDGLTKDQQKRFLFEIRENTDTDRPNLVVDCSNVSRFDTRMIHLLLLCLEEAMKRNGDVRLARLCPQALAALEKTGAARLFRIYNSSAEAVESYHLPFVTPAPIEFERHASI